MDQIVPSLEPADDLLGRFLELIDIFEDLGEEDIPLGSQRVRLFFLKTLVQPSKTQDTLTKRVAMLQRMNDSMKIEDLVGGFRESDVSKLVEHVMRAGAVAFLERDHARLLDAERIMVNRNIETSQNESVILGSPISFTESLDMNIAVLRSSFATAKLAVKTTTMGEDYPRKIAMLYVDTVASAHLIDEVWQQMTAHPERPIRNVQALLKRFQAKWWNPFPSLLAQEIPAETIRMLEQGRVVVFMEHHPFALVAPGSFFDVLEIEEDLNSPGIVTYLLRGLRLLGLLVALLAPAMYVALVGVHPEILRIQLALSIAQSREGVPYPAFIEMLFMLVIIELILESSVRLPKNIGPTITMVGGIILGQAVVQAQLVSNLLIIVISAMAIANFSLVGIQAMFAIRFFKYVFLLFGSVFGVIGVMFGLVWFFVFLCGLKFFGVPYMKRWKIPEVAHES